jgi:hypothetical protein
MSGFDDAILVVIGWAVEKLSAVSILDFISPLILILGVFCVSTSMAMTIKHEEGNRWLLFIGYFLLGLFAVMVS